MKKYDVIIIGGGPAGLSAGLYAGRANLSTLLIEKERAGGQIVITGEIENYPGAVEGESGPSLIERMVRQNQKFGVEHIYDTVTDVVLDGEEKVVKTAGGEYRAKALIVASGARSLSVGCAGEEEFAGRGISFCATCDGPFFEGLEVFVIGGGDAAVEEALHLTKFAKKVTIIHRRDQLRAAKSIQKKAFENEKINFMWDTVVEEIKGGDLVESMVVRNLKTGETAEITADPADGTFGIFVFVGFRPNSELFEGKLAMEKGYIITDEDMKTSVPGVFAAGDVRKKSLRQVVTSVSDGAIAAVQAEKYIYG
ncbi:MAG: thioredoxin-disulfide reductase [Firmicutes bacterium]|nr:thioredoxin-disulfide reductase [Bacillota bacterium]